MPYPAKHLYLTAHWQDTREPNESGQFGIRFQTVADTVQQQMVDKCWAPFETFWTAAGSKIPAPYVLRSLRLALVAENGQYVPGTFSRDYVHITGRSNGTNTTNPMPLQVASVMTLLTDRPSGIGSHGRCYLPPLATALGTDGRWALADVNARSSAFAALLSSLNTVIKQDIGETPNTTFGLPAFASVISKGTPKSPAGVSEFVRRVVCGNRPDVQRRRAKAQREVYGTEQAVTGPTP